MKRLALISAVLVAWSGAVYAQLADTQAPSPAAATPAAGADMVKSYAKVCHERALHQVAWEFCEDFAIVMAGQDTPGHDVLKRISNLTPDAAALARFARLKPSVRARRPRLCSASASA